ncbi:hypothetical protein BC939DRAFT_471643 [Gamsiella multidivaricata]|uniref:uncharacterized protein n=1 Tax=Gamsiella multidivaricata TaxID=101098 RepID=UPI002220064F|nr:uncharacterized protein BC939DRAFT_471643 [Gamsiella multidivaricata]KAI7815791.1 hypothetical protein BC939DRAFT_471643 [Gamsiella multidivaricata]
MKSTTAIFAFTLACLAILSTSTATPVSEHQLEPRRCLAICEPIFTNCPNGCAHKDCGGNCCACN